MWEDGTQFPPIPTGANELHDDWIDHLAKAPQQFQVSLEEFICEHWLHLEKGRGWVVRWRSDQKGIFARRSTLPAVLIYGCLTYADRLFICRNHECPAPYFIASRLDQKYCSNICAGPAKKAAKLKWWHTNLGKKSKAKKSKGKKSVASKRK